MGWPSVTGWPVDWIGLYTSTFVGPDSVPPASELKARKQTGASPTGKACTVTFAPGRACAPVVSTIDCDWTEAWEVAGSPLFAPATHGPQVRRTREIEAMLVPSVLEVAVVTVTVTFAAQATLHVTASPMSAPRAKATRTARWSLMTHPPRGAPSGRCGASSSRARGAGCRHGAGPESLGSPRSCARVMRHCCRWWPAPPRSATRSPPAHRRCQIGPDAREHADSISRRPARAGSQCCVNAQACAAWVRSQWLSVQTREQGAVGLGLSVRPAAGDGGGEPVAEDGSADALAAGGEVGDPIVDAAAVLTEAVSEPDLPAGEPEEIGLGGVVLSAAAWPGGLWAHRRDPFAGSRVPLRKCPVWGPGCGATVARWSRFSTSLHCAAPNAPLRRREGGWRIRFAPPLSPFSAAGGTLVAHWWRGGAIWAVLMPVSRGRFGACRAAPLQAKAARRAHRVRGLREAFGAAR